jgi:hypothetical protein
LTLPSGAGTEAVDVLSVFGVKSKGDITTLDAYSHTLPSLRSETASAMEDVLGEEDESPRVEPSAPPGSTC